MHQMQCLVLFSFTLSSLHGSKSKLKEFYRHEMQLLYYTLEIVTENKISQKITKFTGQRNIRFYTSCRAGLKNYLHRQPDKATWCYVLRQNTLPAVNITANTNTTLQLVSQWLIIWRNWWVLMRNRVIHCELSKKLIYHKSKNCGQMHTMHEKVFTTAGWQTNRCKVMMVRWQGTGLYWYTAGSSPVKNTCQEHLAQSSGLR